MHTASSWLGFKAPWHAALWLRYVFLTCLSAAIQHHAQLADRLCGAGARPEAPGRPYGRTCSFEGGQATLYSILGHI